MKLYLRTAAGIVERDLTDEQAVELACWLLGCVTGTNGGWCGTNGEFAVSEDDDSEAFDCVNEEVKP